MKHESGRQKTVVKYGANNVRLVAFDDFP